MSIDAKIFNDIRGKVMTNKHHLIDMNEKLEQTEAFKKIGKMISSIYCDDFIRAEAKTFKKLISGYVDHQESLNDSDLIKIEPMEFLTLIIFENARIRVFGEDLAKNKHICDYLDSLDPASYMNNTWNLNILGNMRTIIFKQKKAYLTRKIEALIKDELSSDNKSKQVPNMGVSIFSMFKYHPNSFFNEDVKKKTKLLYLMFLYMVLIPPNRIFNILVDISVQPNLYSDLIQEQRNIISKYGKKINLKAIKHMVYLDAFIKESLILSYPASCMHREVQKDTVLSDGTTVPQGSLISANLFSISHKNNNIPQSLRKFDPNRHFSVPAKKTNWSDSLLWGHKNKPCPFYGYSYSQIKLIVAIMIREYSIYANKEGIEPEHPGYVQISTVSPNSKAIYLKKIKI
ncbi:hypothetical protein BB561_003773 [Smittium simulii]|uniref:Cytochrome P450 n=1 Tax=Smittium simulii TaxID=133385 RepID=A0A2T9YJK5_9FUNG|nr:hypothetical protein BB561_003773 [Smittium simulii]